MYSAKTGKFHSGHLGAKTLPVPLREILQTIHSLIFYFTDTLYHKEHISSTLFTFDQINNKSSISIINSDFLRMASSAESVGELSSRQDKTKNVPILSAHSPGNTTSHLVVCGAEQVDDSWLFGDFLGFTSALRGQSPPVNGTFLNCFDLESYFNVMSRKDIKFGRREEIGYEDWSSGDELVYTKFDFDHRTRWWTQLSKEERRTIIPRVL